MKIPDFSEEFNEDILIVDDLTDNLKLLANVLSQAGYPVRAANSGELALRSVQARAPALILLDVRMPGLDGLEVCRRLKADEKTRTIPVLFLSALESESDKLRGFEAGGVDYITKPFHKEEVLARVHTHLNLARANWRLQQKHAETQKYLDIAGVMLVVLRPDQTTALVNKKACAVAGYTEDELLGRNWFDQIAPETVRTEAKSLFNRIMAGEIEPVEQVEMPLRTKNGQEKITTWNTTVLHDKNGKIHAGLASGEDITERKRAEEAIQRLLEEKEILLQEVHHRIKNNMHIISSLLALQSSMLDNPPARQALKEMGERIESMMIVYDQLYRSEDYRYLGLQNYLSILIDSIRATWKEASERVKLLKEIDTIRTPTTLSFQIGLILNELVTNAFKYAFPDGRSGTIRVVVRQQDDQLVLSVLDDGVGLPESLDLQQPTGFGLRLVQILTRQLKGSLQVQRQDGTQYQICVKHPLQT